MAPSIDTWDLFARVAIAVALGALIGLEREIRGQPAGLRTHALVATGAAIFTLTGAYGFDEIARSENVDPTRVAAQVATGIGFIGAGAILKIGLNVRGLTTAATLWMAAALGVAAGAGFYRLALAGAVAVLVVVVGLGFVKTLGRGAVLEVDYAVGRGGLSRILTILDDSGADPGHVKVSEDAADPEALRTVAIRTQIRDAAHFETVSAHLREIPEVAAVRWERDT